jgi:hypothetical protein
MPYAYDSYPARQSLLINFNENCISDKICFFFLRPKASSVIVSPTKFASIRRTLINDSLSLNDEATDGDENRRQLAVKRRYDAEGGGGGGGPAVKPRKRFILLRTRSDGTQYR